MIRILRICLFMLVFLLPVMPVQAAEWGQAVVQIRSDLDRAVALYTQGNPEAASAAVNDAYFGVYEKTGMEAAVRLYISARRAALEEYAFSQLKLLMKQGAPPAQVRQAKDQLLQDLQADATTLGGGTGSQTGGQTADFLSSFLIIAREGLEAVLVLAALIAYAIRANRQEQVRSIYQGAMAALVASLGTAWLLASVLQVSGAAQEALEGISMLLAVVVLFMVSYWLLSKSQARVWQAYVEGKMAASVAKGGRLAMFWAAFLAVYREGAETVLFYQALLSGGARLTPVTLGFVLGAVVLLVLFVLVRWGSLKIPLRPFFATTSLLLYYLAVVFAGKGVRELQEAGWVSITAVAGLPVVDWAGLYPTLETLVPQAALVLSALVAWVVAHRGAIPAKPGAM